ncbi:la-related protein 6B [Oryza sativa Japonica Group]|uniref:Transposon protein, putative, Mutator sub-class, expressed n=1 Tax=Oryza sativa subsp. japonica TaxID=39947 RepID=Q2QVL9_ORYSJ|nr:la-related protein 6B [Oryza sativa Japonica Group]ABA96797.2 transposon protein, putative, Mutator sub-class, expressed [Oryza sativa Japonica Group]
MPQQEVADQIAAAAAERGLQRSGSASRLNAGAPEFVPRVAAPVVPPPPPVIRVFAAAPPPPRAAFFAPPPPHHRPYEYYAPVRGGQFAAAAAAEEQEAEVDPDATEAAEPLVDGFPDEVVHKITKQVEYYFSDINLATTEHLMRFITKDPEGYVPITVIAGFNKIKALVHNNSMLAAALRTSSKLVVSDDGKRVKRLQSFTVSDMQDLQSRIVVAENLPGDPCYQNLMKIFSTVGSVKTIRTCYPQSSNGNSPATNRSAKLDMLFANKLHAFVEYETLEDAEKAILELNDEKNWRNGLRVRLLNTCMTKGAGKGKKGVHEADGNGEEDVSTSNQSNEKQLEEPSQLSDMLPDHLFDDSSNDKEGPRRGRGRGRGGRGRGRGYHQHNNNHFNNQNYHNGQHHNHHANNHHHQGGNRGGAHHVGTPPNQQQTKPEQHPQLPIGATKQPPGPRMPDGTRGFTLGRGKPQPFLPVLCAAVEP